MVLLNFNYFSQYRSSRWKIRIFYNQGQKRKISGFDKGVGNLKMMMNENMIDFLPDITSK